MPTKCVYLSLGSNLGDRDENIRRAIEALAGEQIAVTARSSLYETEPQDFKDQPWFLNLVIACETRLFPKQLLSVLQRIERELGRTRTGVPAKGPRTIDIDILFYGNAVIETPQLTIPHPRLLQRRFVLEPLLEIAPDFIHPLTRRPLAEWLPKLASQKLSRR